MSDPQRAPSRRPSWIAAMKKGFRRDFLIGTLGFAFGSMLIGIQAAIPVQEESAIATEVAPSA